jgi:uncharacterized protein YkwD/uncharacterized membrane protein required for colicin V production
MMLWLVSLIILGAVIYGGFSGYRRGLIFITLELLSFAIATLVALSGYHLLGGGIKAIFGVTISLGNVAAFIMLWALMEVLCAVLIHRFVIRRLPSQEGLEGINKIGGMLFGAFRTAAIITLGLVVFAGLPISASTKRQVTDAPVATLLLASSGDLPNLLAQGLGHDINDGFDFFTITAQPKSEVVIELGYSTNDVVVDARAENAMLVLLNHERTSHGLKPLTLNITAQAVARTYSAAMFSKGFFSHIGKDGRTPFDRMDDAGISYTSAGENLALAPTYQQAHDGLMKSPEHRANILSTSYRTVGIGVVDGGKYGLMVTEDFTD